MAKTKQEQRARRSFTGFSDEELAVFERARPLLALHFRLTRATYATRSLFEVYLGPNSRP